MPKLTKKELEIVKLLCLENKKIGERLGISRATVQTHIENIRYKVESISRAGILIELIKAGILNIDDVVTN